MRALGLDLGHDVLDLLDEMEATRSRSMDWLLSIDATEAYAACRAWALAARGRTEAAREALPAELFDKYSPTETVPTN